MTCAERHGRYPAADSRQLLRGGNRERYQDGSPWSHSGLALRAIPPSVLFCFVLFWFFENPSEISRRCREQTGWPLRVYVESSPVLFLGPPLQRPGTPHGIARNRNRSRETDMQRREASAARQGNGICMDMGYCMDTMALYAARSPFEVEESICHPGGLCMRALSLSLSLHGRHVGKSVLSACIARPWRLLRGSRT